MLVGRNVMEGSQGPDILSSTSGSLLSKTFMGHPGEYINLLLRPLHAIGRNELIRARAGEHIDGRIDSGLGRIARGKYHTGNPDTEAQSRGRMEPVGFILPPFVSTLSVKYLLNAASSSLVVDDGKRRA